jgi:CRP/FNR family cyclic AMP-dependent transcriptional regulator
VPAAVHILDADPDLGAGIPAEQWPLAARAAVAPADALPKGAAWPIRDPNLGGNGHLGLLIVEGIVARHVTIGPRSGLELLGPGDVLRPWIHSRYELACVDWSVIAPVRLASLDRGFADRVAPWPQIAAAIGERLLLRVRNLSELLAISHLVTVEERLLMSLWHFANRWGRVTPHGVVLRLPLTHEVLAAVVGARRPPVTTALGLLAQKGLVQRSGEGAWILTGAPRTSGLRVCADYRAHVPAPQAGAPVDPGPVPRRPARRNC